MDGLDREMLERLMDEGELPHFQRLAREGILTDLRTTRPILSPVIWTSIASGYGADAHGVLGWSRGDGSAFTSQDVSVDRIWESASEANLQSFVAGWLMSWPATELKGELLTERLVLSYPMNKDPEDESVGISRRAHRRMKGLTWPAELIDTATESIPLADEAPESLAHQLEEFSAPFHPWVRDETQLRAFEAHWPRNETSLGMIYLASADQVSHLYWPFTDRQVERQLRARPDLRVEAAAEDLLDRGGQRAYPFAETPITPEELAQAATWVPEIYRWLDDALGRVMVTLDPETTLIVCSDHGFQPGQHRPVLNGGHRDPGVLGLWGGATRPGQTQDASILDIGPTLYRLLELPLAQDMPGTALDQVLDLPPPPDPVDSYTRTPSRAPLPAGAGDEVHRQQLEALGYVDSDGAPLPGSSRVQAPHAP